MKGIADFSLWHTPFPRPSVPAACFSFLFGILTTLHFHVWSALYLPSYVPFSLSRRCCCVRMRKWGYEVVTSRRFALPRPYMDSLWSPPAKRRNFCVCGWAHLAGRIRELKVVSDVGINWGRKDGGAWKKKKSEGTSGGSELGRPFHLIHASTFVMSNGVTILRNLLFLTGRSALLEDVSLSLSYF